MKCPVLSFSDFLSNDTSVPTGSTSAISAGMNVSLTLIFGAFGLFAMLFMLKMVTKFAGVYLLACRYIPD